MTTKRIIIIKNYKKKSNDFLLFILTPIQKRNVALADGKKGNIKYICSKIKMIYLQKPLSDAR